MRSPSWLSFISAPNAVKSPRLNNFGHSSARRHSFTPNSATPFTVPATFLLSLVGVEHPRHAMYPRRLGAWRRGATPSLRPVNTERAAARRHGGFQERLRNIRRTQPTARRESPSGPRKRNSSNETLRRRFICIATHLFVRQDSHIRVTPLTACSALRAIPSLRSALTAFGGYVLITSRFVCDSCSFHHDSSAKLVLAYLTLTHSSEIYPFFHPRRNRNRLCPHSVCVAPEVEIDIAELHLAALRIEEDVV